MPRLLMPALAALLIALAALPSAPAWAEPALASAPVEIGLFRDGEVQRSTETHGGWTVVCDLVPRLKHRFCSLRAAPVAIGSAKVALTVSTGDDGRPAALLRLPFGLSLPYGVWITAMNAAGRGKARRIPVALCSADACEAVWSLDSDEIAALHRGKGLQVSVQGWRFTPLGKANTGPAPISTLVAAQGFAEGVATSMR
ncbi:invasion associated locus B family protein [Lichenihabitans sp. Uapishka_5]|uniref:invasion associated locus B family protein n=1 Tax=Lichenihabitans sp. Uapishka_5 TaxID=3037302 RepID=UPI0029E80DC4|nr:invasion associated locus B family protein [Lichenihabitans sp. Uapishka_5]MDX7950024.1 invasion associated locus B family protein [Lichenihabitans sp. Uapishka_5]